MPALREVDEVEAPDKSALNDPNLDGAAVFLEELFMDSFDGFLAGEFGYLSYQFGLATLLQLDGIGFLQGFVIGHALGHQSMLDKQMVNEKLFFAQAVLLVDPEFVHRNEAEAEVLAEVRELLVDSSPDILAIHDPDDKARNLVEFLEVRLLHDSPLLISCYLYLSWSDGRCQIQGGNEFSAGFHGAVADSRERRKALKPAGNKGCRSASLTYQRSKNDTRS
jgi:hypothetical protein